jgi:lipopolysaccharide/colanic/teichoic acid biosynthesis glycosyltransferase
MKQVTRTRIIFAVYDLFLVVLFILLTAYIHDDLSFRPRHDSYYIAFALFPVVWVCLSQITRKFRIGERTNQKEVFFSILFSNFTILSITTILLILFQLTFFSRFILFGTITGITLMEMITGFIYVAIQKSIFIRDWIGIEITKKQFLVVKHSHEKEALASPQTFGALHDSIIEESGEKAFTWIWGHVDITNPKNLILSTDTRFNLINYQPDYFHSVVNLHRINNLQRINKFFETVNDKLPIDGIFIGCAETYMLRKQRFLAKFPPVINYIAYTIDFFIHRVFPKLALTNKLYFLITGGKKRVISRTETLGRLCSCGFEILEEKTIDNLLYWKARKIRAPYYDNDPTYGIFIRLRRIGKDGREFNVFKLRTMHAFAEYVQSYVYDNHQLDDGGKFKDDFRVTTLGRFMRKFWIDELPMVLNMMKGDMKLVGVRPLSKHYFSLYSEELQRKRTKVKPGLVPPYYAQHPTPTSLEDVQRNELEYLQEYEKHPFKTDVKYFFRAMYNIFLRNARSK